MVRHIVLVLLLLTGCNSDASSPSKTSRTVGIPDASVGNGGKTSASSGGASSLAAGGGGAVASGGLTGSGGAPGSGSGGAAGSSVANAGGATDIADAAIHPDSAADSGENRLVGDPLWYGTGADVYKGLDDPRWGGAPITSFANDPVGTAAGYRLLVNGSMVSMSFEALAPPAGAPTLVDTVYLGITTNSGGTSGRILVIHPRDSGAPDPVAWNPGLDFQMFAKTSAAGSWIDMTPGTSPTWLLDSVYTWRNSPVGAVWALNLKVDLSGFGVASTSAFHMAYGMTLHTPAGTSTIDFFTPDFVPSVSTPRVLGTVLPADMTSWPTYLRH